MTHPKFAEVVLPLPVDHAFTYAIPEEFADRVVPGMRAVVPVLKRVETGYIVALSAATEVPNVRPLLDLPDPAPAVSPEMLELCKWVADYYCCALGEALQCAVPSGLKIRTKMRYRLAHAQLPAGRYSDRQRAILEILELRGPLTESQIDTVVGRGGLRNALHALVSRGVLTAEPIMRRASVSILTETCVRLIEANIPSTEVLSAMQRTAPKQAAVLLDLLHGEPERAVSTLYERHEVGAPVMAALEKKKYVLRFDRDFYRRPEFEADAKLRDKLVLIPQQKAAFDAIVGSIDRGEFQTFLLHGITGSGKTEVYLQAIEHTLAGGRNAILLVPEISLTRQTVGRLLARFREQIAVLHSGLGMGERYDEWRRAQQGQVRIVVGARSAVFAPLRNVGLIVVDEEHDGSYKQSDAPRYHARDVAIMRANQERAVCVLGSATPSVESYYKSENAKFIRLEIPRRATNARLPEVQLVDMREESKETSGQIILSRLLEEEVQARVRAGEQVILLLNRRGYAPFVLCPKCGWIAQCTNCNVSLVYHAKGAFLGCHYCNGRRDVPEVCDACGFNPLIFLGLGTQRAEDFLLRTFSTARIERMDADTTAGKGGHAKILGRFAAGEIDILIGTQMIAKGHDYPGVTLVGVLNADTSFMLPDFRAAESAFQLLTQVAGRAGRGDRPGKVIFQTYRPNHYAVQAATRHDYAAFYGREIREREGAGYPPLRRMANFSVESEDPLTAERFAAHLERIVRDQIGTLEFRGVEVLGPSPALVFRVKKRYRWNLAVLSKSAKRLNTLARATRNAFAEQSQSAKVLLKVDLDPYGAF